MATSIFAPQTECVPEARLQLTLQDRQRLVATGDLIVVNLSILLALFLWTLADGSINFRLSFIRSQLHWFPLLNLLWMLLVNGNDFYGASALTRFGAMLWVLMQISAQSAVVYVVVFFFSPVASLPRLFMLFYLIAAFLLLALWRILLPILMQTAVSQRRILVIGSGSDAQELVALLGHHASVYELVGYPVEGERVRAIDPHELARIRDLAAHLSYLQVREIVLSTQLDEDKGLLEQLARCYERGIDVRTVIAVFEELTGRFPIQYVSDMYSLFSNGHMSRFQMLYGELRRVVDIAVALLGLACFVLILPLLAAAIWIDSPGPIFFRQERVGKHGRHFTLFKLRSMIPNAERVTGPTWSPDADARVTRVGRLLRRSRLDEVPQLWNVLMGEMSLIGPRPERPFYVEQLQRRIPFYRLRLAVVPGLTGWAQVNYSYGNSTQDALEKLKYDLYYIRHASLQLDASIAFKTLLHINRLGGQ